jgi:peptidoglycan DL-endopeptidase CwlO
MTYFIRKYLFLVFVVVATILPCSVSLAALRSGDIGESIYELQERLAALHYDVFVDGDYGPVTEAAVRKFQQDNGFEADGIVDKSTWDALVRLSPTVSRANRPVGDRLIAIARQFIGAPYVFGATGPNGFDCSGFTQYVFSQAGVQLFRAADDQYTQGRSVSRDVLHAGDLVFFSTYEPGPSHVGIYMNNGYFIHAGSSTGVTISHLSNRYWAARYIGAKRILR